MCKYCSDFNEEKEEMEVSQIYLSSSAYFNYECPIIYCPNCGKKLNKYKQQNSIHTGIINRK